MKTLRVTYRLHSGRKVQITCAQDVAKSIARALYPGWVPYGREDKEQPTENAVPDVVEVGPFQSTLEFLLPGTNRREQVIVAESDTELVCEELQKAGWQMLGYRAAPVTQSPRARRAG